MVLFDCPEHGCSKAHLLDSWLDSNQEGIGQHYQEVHVDQHFLLLLVHQHFQLFLGCLTYHQLPLVLVDLEARVGQVYLLLPDYNFKLKS